MDKGLEEQLERVRHFSEQVAQIHDQLAENIEMMTRDRATRNALDPMHPARQHSSDPAAKRRRGSMAAERPRYRRRSR